MKGKIIVAFVVGFSVFMLARIVQVYLLNNRQFMPSTRKETGVPTNSIEVKVATYSGELKILRRADSEFTPYIPDTTIVEGETIAITTNSNSSFLLGDTITIRLIDQAEVDLSSLQPSHILLRQKEGSISYETTAPQEISIRSLHILITLSDGMITITTQSPKIGILSAGTARLAMVDSRNDTHVWQLTDGDTATTDDTNATIVTTATELPRETK